MTMRRFAGPALLTLSLLAAPALAWDAARGKEISEACVACHGPDGNSPSPDFPRLAGQHDKYLYRAMLDYKLGNRQNPIMAAMVANLSRADMRDLAAFYASQEGLYLKR